ncbi:MAG: hypothetical protein IJ491_07635 [Clostridia bacterium]|nr:hypothetical protein [Clostridia bacterium]
MNSTLKQLGQEYERSIQVQTEIIRKNRERLSAARNKCNFKEVQRLNSLLKTLYEEKWELEEKAVAIKKYYT